MRRSRGDAHLTGAALAGLRRAVFGLLGLALLLEARVCLVEAAPWPVWLFRLLPLLLFLPGLLADRLRSHIWLCLVCLLYFTAAVLRWFAAPAEPAAMLGVATIAGLFVCSMYYVRWRARQLKEVTRDS